MFLKVLGYCNALKPLRMKKPHSNGTFGIAGHNFMKTDTEKKDVASSKAGKEQARRVTIIILMLMLRGSYTVLFIRSSKVL